MAWRYICKRHFAAAFVVLLVATPVLADDDEGGSSKVVTVNCERQSIEKALKKNADELIINIKGQCHESVLIDRDHVTLRGITSDTAILSPGEAPAVTIEAAKNVALEQLLLEGGAANGVEATGAISLSLIQVTVQNSRTGLALSGGTTTTVSNSSFLDNTRDGISVYRGAHLEVAGAIQVSRNARTGLIASALSSVSFSPAGCRLQANQNWVGLWTQSGAVVSLSGPEGSATELVDNARYGVAVLGGQLMARNISSSGATAGIRTLKEAYVELQGDVVSSNNTRYGLWSTSESVVHVAGNSVFERNGSGGIYAASGASVFAGDYYPSVVRDNAGWGILVDGGRAQLQNTTVTGNSIIDVDLRFGAAVDFQGGNLVGAISCEDSVLVRGDISCPAAGSLTVKANVPRDLSVHESELEDLIPLAQLEQ